MSVGFSSDILSSKLFQPPCDINRRIAGCERINRCGAQSRSKCRWLSIHEVEIYTCNFVFNDQIKGYCLKADIKQYFQTVFSNS